MKEWYMTGTNVTELKISTIRAYGDKSVGCISNSASIMISYQTVGSGNITDMFLSQEQAESLLSDLSRCVLDNKTNPRKEYYP